MASVGVAGGGRPIVGMGQTGGARQASGVTAMGTLTDMFRTMATMAVPWCGSDSGTAMAGERGPFRSAADNNPSGELRRDPWRDIKPPPPVPNRRKFLNKNRAARAVDRLGPIPESHFENEPTYPPKNVYPPSKEWLEYIEAVKAERDKY
jgi:hypothetical protein